MRCCTRLHARCWRFTHKTGGKGERGRINGGSRSEVRGFGNDEPRTSNGACHARLAVHAPRSVVPAAVSTFCERPAIIVLRSGASIRLTPTPVIEITQFLSQRDQSLNLPDDALEGGLNFFVLCSLQKRFGPPKYYIERGPHLLSQF